MAKKKNRNKDFDSWLESINPNTYITQMAQNTPNNANYFANGGPTMGLEYYDDGTGMIRSRMAAPTTDYNIANSPLIDYRTQGFDGTLKMDTLSRRDFDYRNMTPEQQTQFRKYNSNVRQNNRQYRQDVRDTKIADLNAKTDAGEGFLGKMNTNSGFNMGAIPGLAAETARVWSDPNSTKLDKVANLFGIANISQLYSADTEKGDANINEMTGRLNDFKQNNIQDAYSTLGAGQALKLNKGPKQIQLMSNNLEWKDFKTKNVLGKTIGAIGQGAASGGSVGGAWGAAGGAVTGLFAGIGSLFGRKKRAQKAYREYINKLNYLNNNARMMNAAAQNEWSASNANAIKNGVGQQNINDMANFRAYGGNLFDDGGDLGNDYVYQGYTLPEVSIIEEAMPWYEKWYNKGKRALGRGWNNFKKVMATPTMTALPGQSPTFQGQFFPTMPSTVGDDLEYALSIVSAPWDMEGIGQAAWVLKHPKEAAKLMKQPVDKLVEWAKKKVNKEYQSIADRANSVEDALALTKDRLRNGIKYTPNNNILNMPSNGKYIPSRNYFYSQIDNPSVAKYIAEVEGNPAFQTRPFSKFNSEDETLSYLRHNSLGRTRKYGTDSFSSKQVDEFDKAFNDYMKDYDYQTFDSQTWKKAGKEELAGFHDPKNKYIAAVKDSKIPLKDIKRHEVRHAYDNYGDILSNKQHDILDNAYGSDFVDLPKNLAGNDPLKGYSNMHLEKTTTNLDARKALLKGREETASIDVQNMIIDKMTDDKIIEAVRNSNGYGKRYIEYLEKNNLLTPQKVQAFRNAMKYVGIGTGVGLITNNTGYAMGGNLYTDLSPNMMNLWNDKQNIDKQKIMNQQMNFGLGNSFNQKLNTFGNGGNLFGGGGDLTDEQRIALADIQANPRILFTPKYSQWRDYIRRTSPNYLDRLYTSLPYEQQQDIYQNDREAWGALSNEAKGRYGAEGSRRAMNEAGKYTGAAMGLIGMLPAMEAVSMFPMLESGLNAYFGYEGAKNLPTAITDTYDYAKEGDWSRAGLSAGEAVLDGMFIGNGIKGAKNLSELSGLSDRIYNTFPILDPYTTSGATFGYHGASALDRLLGTVSRRNGFTYKPEIPEFHRRLRINEPNDMRFDENGNFILSSGRTGEGHDGIVNFATSEPARGHKSHKTLSGIDDYIVNPEALKNQKFISIEPSDTFFETGELAINPKDITLVSGNPKLLDYAKSKGFNTLSSPKLREYYKKNYAESTNSNKLNLTKEGANVSPRDVGDEIQRLTSRRGAPTLEDYRFFENETGLSSGVVPIEEYNAIGQQALYGHSPSLRANLNWNNVAYDPATQVESLYRKAKINPDDVEAVKKYNEYIDNLKRISNNTEHAMGGNLYTDLSPNMMSIWNNKQQIDQQKANMQQINFGLGNSFNYKNMFPNGGQLNSSDLPDNAQYYANGGTHEENPYGGIQVGVDQQGNPNLVEEGEFRWGDYIFSDRIEVDPDILTNYTGESSSNGKKRGKKGKHQPTYADKAKKYAEKNKELANDPIGKNTINDYMSKLSKAEEEQKARDAAQQEYNNALANQTQGNPMYGSMKYNGMGNANAGLNEGNTSIGSMDNSGLSNVNRSGNEMLHAFGGNLFWNGGTTDPPYELWSHNYQNIPTGQWYGTGTSWDNPWGYGPTSKPSAIQIQDNGYMYGKTDGEAYAEQLMNQGDIPQVSSEDWLVPIDEFARRYNTPSAQPQVDSNKPMVDANGNIITVNSQTGEMFANGKSTGQTLDPNTLDVNQQGYNYGQSMSQSVARPNTYRIGLDGKPMFGNNNGFIGNPNWDKKYDRTNPSTDFEGVPLPWNPEVKTVPRVMNNGAHYDMYRFLDNSAYDDGVSPYTKRHLDGEHYSAGTGTWQDYGWVYQPKTPPTNNPPVKEGPNTNTGGGNGNTSNGGTTNPPNTGNSDGNNTGMRSNIDVTGNPGNLNAQYAAGNPWQSTPYQEWTRFGAMAKGLPWVASDAMGHTNWKYKIDNVPPDRMEALGRTGLALRNADHSGMFRAPDLMDVEKQNNASQSLLANALRGISNVGGGNRGFVGAQSAAQNYNAQMGIGNNYATTNAYNADQKLKADEFNKQTEQFNANANNQMEADNQRAKQFAKTYEMTGLQNANAERLHERNYKDAVDRAAAADRANNVTNMWDNALNFMANEAKMNHEYNMFNSDATQQYYWDKNKRQFIFKNDPNNPMIRMNDILRRENMGALSANSQKLLNSYIQQYGNNVPQELLNGLVETERQEQQRLADEKKTTTNAGYRDLENEYDMLLADYARRMNTKAEDGTTPKFANYTKDDYGVFEDLRTHRPVDEKGNPISDDDYYSRLRMRANMMRNMMYGANSYYNVGAYGGNIRTKKKKQHYYMDV